MRIFITLFILVYTGQVARADCTCRDRETDVTEGKTVCLQTPKGPQLARCEKVLNVTSWKFLGEGCPLAGRGRDTELQTAALGAH
jgi:hypothetical protein